MRNAAPPAAAPARPPSSPSSPSSPSRLTQQAHAALVPAAKLADVMRRTGGPRRPSDIGISHAFYAGAVRHARYLRDRFTFLDLAADAVPQEERVVA